MRQEFTAATQREAWARCDGRCEGLVDRGAESFRCDAPIDIGCFHYDHITPCWMGGDNSLDNCQVLCLRCHREKTRIDVSNIAKVKRILDRQKGIRRRRSQWRYGKDSPLKRKVTGEVVPRWD